MNGFRSSRWVVQDTGIIPRRLVRKVVVHQDKIDQPVAGPLWGYVYMRGEKLWTLLHVDEPYMCCINFFKICFGLIWPFPSRCWQRRNLMLALDFLIGLSHPGRSELSSARFSLSVFSLSPLRKRVQLARESLSDLSDLVQVPPHIQSQFHFAVHWNVGAGVCVILCILSFCPAVCNLTTRWH